MAYIYQIQNDVNGKLYVGKTEFSIKKRFKEHCNDAFRDRNEKRPLYSAMRKYGIEHFHISLIEETDNPEEREKYWIEYLGTFKNGYNATMGGDGAKYIDYDLVVKTYNKVQNQAQTARILNISVNSVKLILENCNIKSISLKQVSQEVNGIQINQFTLSDEFIQTFPSAMSALESIKGKGYGTGGASHILDVCRGIRKSAYGYHWKFFKNLK